MAYTPYRRTHVPSAYERLLMTRMGTGYTPRLWAQLEAAGGASAWFARQLRPGTVTESPLARAVPTWFPDLEDSVPTKWRKNDDGVKGSWEYGKDLESVTILRRVYSNRPVLETVSDLWANHFHIPTNADLPWAHRWDYEKTVRAHAFGSFATLLRAVTLHPAMLLYLNTFESRAPEVNENHGRELLELHTVGRDAGYTEDMVVDTARILSGWTVDAWGDWEPSYQTGYHATGEVSVLGFTRANGARDGREVTWTLLDHLARHPSTAHRIARKIAVKFVSDEPSDALVGLLARTYLDHGTEIRPVLTALVTSAEFKASAGLKVRTPHEDLIATIRALDVRVAAPADDNDYARSVVWAHGGLALYHWPRPDGLPEDGVTHASVSRLLSSFDMHWCHAGGWWPTGQVRYRKAAWWLPAEPLRMDQYVDHLSRTFFGRPAPSWAVTSALAATGTTAATEVDKDHAVASWLGVRLIGALLDSPLHMSR